MIDREKVKKGLECCKASMNDDPFQRCSECPYNDISISVQDCRAVLSADALELLKEQEAVTPYIDIDEAKCPICKVKLTRQELLGDNVLYEDFFDYCPHCGRKVKWE